LAISKTRDIQTTLKALKRQIDIARLPSSKSTLPNYENRQLGNVATNLEFIGCKYMWTPRKEMLANGRTIRVVIDRDSTPISYAEILHSWQSDANFREIFTGLLADAPFSAFRFETPPLTTLNANRPFEFVLLDSPDLNRAADADAFAEHFKSASKTGVVAFPNLGHDAIMIVPCPIAGPSAYGHLAAFVRQAPEEQRHALWVLVGAEASRRLSKKPFWLSTAGAGVSWLHVRLDDRPKYYGYEPYRRAT
jgi:hypothetical protein